MRRRDGLRKLALAALTLPFPPSARRSLLEDHALASEESCDRHAAASLGEPAVVARVLLAVTRLEECWDAPLPALACRFAMGRTEQRVRGLLGPGWEPAEPGWMAAILTLWLGVGVAVIASAARLHHAVETALSVVFGT